METSTTAAVLTADFELLDQVLSCAAAAGVRPEVVADASGARALWGSAAVVVVGVDQAESLARLGLGPRSHVYVVGTAGDRELLLRWSVPLGAAVVVVPVAAGSLTASLADAVTRGQAAGRVVTVVGGSGGVGTSTFAGALAVAAVRRRWSCVLVDADPLGGGLDLLMGAERLAGWRWPKLAGARGELGDLSTQLPQVDGVHLLSGSRETAAAAPATTATPALVPAAEQLTAVVSSTRRTHQLTVVDLPRSADAAVWTALRGCEVVVLVVRADVRGLAAARRLLDRTGDLKGVGVVVRGRLPGVSSAEVCADGLGLPLYGVVPDDSVVRLAAERGDPPGRSGRTVLARGASAVLARLDDDRRSA